MAPSRQELLDSIRPGMRLDRALFIRVYGYEISFPGFADEAIAVLENAGCRKAREYYDMAVSEYQCQNDRELRPAARQIRRQWEAEWKKGGREQRKQEIMQGLQKKNDRELLNLLQSMS